MLKPWKTLSEREVYRNKHWLTVIEQAVELPNGHVIPDYLITGVPDVAMVFPLTRHGEVVLVEQYKHGVEDTALDLPAGYIDEGEDPFEAAKRELEEETGYVGDDWTPLGGYFYDENRHARRFHYFMLRDARADGVQHFDDTEELVVHRLPLGEVAEAVLSGRVQGLHSALGIFRALHAIRQDGDEGDQQ